MLRKYSLWIAWAAAFGASAGSLILSEGLGWLPCTLCWYQRSMMYPLAVIFTIALFHDIRDLKIIALPLAYIGAAIALFHTMLQYGWLPDAAARCVSGVSCTIPYHFYFNFLTIPLASLLTFACIIISMHLLRKEIND